MKIYIASSWKNEEIVKKLAYILRADGHEVDVFCDPSTGRYVFDWRGLPSYKNLDAKTAIQRPEFQKAFEEDKKWLDWCEVLILLYPCGNSSHLEGGYVKGQGKNFYIFGGFTKTCFDVMYGFADGIFRVEELEDLRRELLRKSSNGKPIATQQNTVPADWEMAFLNGGFDLNEENTEDEDLEKMSLFYGRKITFFGEEKI